MPPAPATSSVPTTFDAERGKFYLGHWQGVSITVFADRADEDFIRRAAAMAKHWKQHYPEKRSNVSFVLSGVRPPVDEVRATFEFQRSGGTGIVCFGIVLEGTGFWASTLRSTITGLNLAGGGRIAARTELTIEALVPWLAREHAARVGETLPEAALARALSAARYELAPPLLFPDSA